MLKSTLNAAKPSEPKGPTLPHLFRENNMGIVVLFYSRRSGMVVAKSHDSGGLSLGDYWQNWLDCFNTKYWTPLKPGESITITVEED